MRTRGAAALGAILLLASTALVVAEPARAEELRLVTQAGHAGLITAVALSPDGRLGATGGADNQIVLWHLASGLELRRWADHAGQVDRLAFSPDGRRLLSASTYDGRSRLWDVATGALASRLDLAPIAGVLEIAFPGGIAHVLSSCASNEDEEGDVVLRRVADGAERGRFRPPLQPPSPDFPDRPRSAQLDSCVLSPEGAQACGGLRDGTVCVWDLASGREVRRQRMHGSPVRALVFSANGRRLASCADEGMVVVADAASGTVLQTLEGHPEGVHHLAFSADGGVLAVSRPGEPEARVVVWDVKQGVSTADVMLATFHTAPVAVSADGRWVLAGRGMVAELREASSGALLRELTGTTAGIDRLAFSADGTRLLTRAAAPVLPADDPDAEPAHALRVLDLEGRREVGRYEPGVPEWSRVAFSPDGRRVLFAFDDMTHEWIVDTGETRERWRTPSQTLISDLGYSARGPWVRGEAFDGNARLWYACEPDGDLVALPVTTVGAAAFTPDGDPIVTADPEGRRLQVWDADARRVVKTLDVPGAGPTFVRRLAFLPEGRRAVSIAYRAEGEAEGRSGGVLRVWDLSTGALLWERVETGVRYQDVDVSPDGRSLLLIEEPGVFQDLVQKSSAKVRFLDADAGRPRREVRGFDVGLTSALFSPGGDIVLFGEDGSVRFLNPDSARERCRQVRSRDGSWVVVRPDGRFDASDPGRVRGLHWVVPDAPFDPLPLEIFMRAYYEPRLLERTLGGEDFPPLPDLGSLNRLQPRVEIVEIAADPADPDAVRVTVAVESVRVGDRESGVHDVQLFRDDRLVAWASALALDAGSGRVVFEDVRLPRDGRESVELSAYAFNDDRVKSVTHRVPHALPKERARRRGKAYLVCVGVDIVQTSSWNLAFAASDARALASSLWAKLAFTETFADVVPVVLTSEIDAEGERVDRATRRDVETVLRLLAGADVSAEARARIPEASKLARACPEDLVVLTFSTHGYGRPGGFFHLLPSDIGANARVADDALLERCISTDLLSTWLRPIDAGEMILVVDACQAAASVETEGFKPGPMGDRGLGQLAWDKRLRVLAASQAADVALESDVLQHGLLTYALVVEGLGEERADFAPADGLLYLDEWLRWGVNRVPGLAEELARGLRHASGDRGPLRIKRRARARRVVQQPTLFDFARGTSRVVLQ